MPYEIIIALLSLCGTAIGSVTGILTANRLTNYRIEQLEKRVAEHNCLVWRMTSAEERLSNQQHQINDIKEMILK